MAQKDSALSGEEIKVPQILTCRGEEKDPSNPFNEIVKLDDRDIQKILQEIDSHDLAMALVQRNIGIDNKIFKNMTKQASAMVYEDREFMGPVRYRDVLEGQKKILLMVRHWANTGEIVLPEDFRLPDDLDEAFAARQKSRYGTIIV